MFYCCTFGLFSVLKTSYHAVGSLIGLWSEGILQCSSKRIDPVIIFRLLLRSHSIMVVSLCLNPVMLTAARSGLTILRQKQLKGKKIERRLLFRILPTPLLQIFCKSFIIPFVNSSIAIDLDHNFKRNT